MANAAAGIIGGSLVGGLISAGGARSAASTQAAATRAGIAEQRRQFDLTRKDLWPWRERGRQSLNRLRILLGVGPRPEQESLRAMYGTLTEPFTAQDFRTSPGYEFRLGEGQKALERSAAAAGGLYSGAAGKALQRYGQQFASEEFMNAFNRDQAEKARIYNMLAGTSGVGQTTATQIGQMGMGSASNIANLLTQGGNAAAAGRVGVANALAGGVQDIGTYYALQGLLNPPAASAPSNRLTGLTGLAQQGYWVAGR